MYKTDLHSSLLFLMLKLEEAKSNPMLDKNFVVALTEKKAYESQKDSLADVDNSAWGKALNGFLTSKVKEDGVDAELPDIDSLIKKLTSDEYIEKKIKDVLGDDVADRANKE